MKLFQINKERERIDDRHSYTSTCIGETERENVVYGDFLNE